MADTRCGGPSARHAARRMFLTNGAHAGVRGLYAGSLDDPSWYKPSREIYVASAQPWALMHPDLPKDHAGAKGDAQPKASNRRLSAGRGRALDKPAGSVCFPDPAPARSGHHPPHLAPT